MLRKFLGLRQKEFAEKIGYSVGTVQAIEILTLKLSKELALKISITFGVSVAWLLDGKPEAPMVDRLGNPYTWGSLHAAETQDARFDTRRFFDDFGLSITLLYQLLYKAHEAPDYSLVKYQIQKALIDLLVERKVEPFDKANRATLEKMIAGALEAHLGEDPLESLGNELGSAKPHRRALEFMRHRDPAYYEFLLLADEEAAKSGPIPAAEPVPAARSGAAQVNSTPSPRARRPKAKKA